MSAAAPPGRWQEARRLGLSGPEVTGLGLGCAPIGNLYAPVSEEDAVATVTAAFDAGIRYFDTAPLYGHGLSERRLGAALARYPRDDYVVSTKVGRLVREDYAGLGTRGIFDGVRGEVEWDFSAAGVQRSLVDSLERLGMDRIDIALVHDPDDHEEEALAVALPALISLREQGVVRAVGCGMNQTAMLERFVERVDLDCVLLAGRYSLLDRSGADRLLPLCEDRGVGVILGGVFNSGVLADPVPGASYDYSKAQPEILVRARRMQEMCGKAGLSLQAAALAFASGHSAVTTLVIGARSSAEVNADLTAADSPVPPELWAALEGI
ncbi:MAG: aldo/keto reductase [Acidimicrobiales bacterium]